VIEQSVCDESSFSVSSISTLKCNFAFWLYKIFNRMRF
jgi:hypothetical protein